MFRFEKFEVWRQAIDFAGLIYDTTRAFPREEQFGLISQMRRAAVSISSNVAEGTSRSSDRDFLRFVEIAYGSLMEVVSQAHIATSQKMVDESGFMKIYDTAEELAKKLSALRNTLLGPQ
jgi:four helix bundle protein